MVVQRGDMEKIYPQAHVACLPFYREGLSNILFEAMITAIERLLGDRELRLRMGGLGRETAERDFSQKRITDQALAIYSEPCMA